MMEIAFRHEVIDVLHASGEIGLVLGQVRPRLADAGQVTVLGRKQDGDRGSGHASIAHDANTIS
ncbi:MAG: hypothetical protein ACK5SX_14825 [Sandaracinobacter sp.]